MVSETYGDWVMRCTPAGDGRRCELSQTIIVQGQSQPIALVAFGREKKGEPIRMVVQLPTNVAFDGGVRALTSSGDASVEMAFRRCFPSGCFADAALSDTVIARMKAQTEPLSIRFRDATERDIALPVSLKGFAAAIEALARS